MLTGLEHLSCEKRLSELELFNLEKALRILHFQYLRAFQYLRGPQKSWAGTLY